MVITYTVNEPGPLPLRKWFTKVFATSVAVCSLSSVGLLSLCQIRFSWFQLSSVHILSAGSAYQVKLPAMASSSSIIHHTYLCFHKTAQITVSWLLLWSSSQKYRISSFQKDPLWVLRNPVPALKLGVSELLNYTSSPGTCWSFLDLTISISFWTFMCM